MPNVVNELLVRELDASLEKAEGMVVCSLAGMTVLETEGLRRKLADKGLRMRVVRNRLARRVLEKHGLALDAKAFQGTVGVVTGSSEDAIHAAKVVTGSDLIKSGKLGLRAGMLEKRVLGATDVRAMASIPDRKTLQAQLLGCLSGSARQLVTVLSATPSATARVIQGRADSLPRAPEASADATDAAAPDAAPPAA